MENPWINKLFTLPIIKDPIDELHELRLHVAKELKLLVNYDSTANVFDIDVINRDWLKEFINSVDGFTRNVILSDIGLLKSIVHYYYHNYLESEFVNSIYTPEVQAVIEERLIHRLMRDYNTYPGKYVLHSMYRANLMPYEARMLDEYIFTKGDN